jgi:uncharacterized membrane protein YhaH (DUF805 family)
MDWTFVLFSLEGRINRMPYWIATIGLAVTESIVEYGAAWAAGEIAGAAISIISLYPSYAVDLKRAHDRGRSAWLIVALYAAMPVFVLLPLLGYDLEALVKRPAFGIVAVVWALLAIFLFIDLGFMRGTRGPNRFGPDPLEGQRA